MIINNKDTGIKLLLAFVGCFTFLLSFSQQPVLKATADKNEILIGEQFTVKVETAFAPDTYRVDWLTVPDTFGHFEIINRSEIDTVYTNNKLTGFEQSFTLTSFDSGKWAFPSLAVNIQSLSDGAKSTAYTDSFSLTVAYSVSDTTKELKDIKPIQEAEAISYLWYWVGGIIGVLVLIMAVILLYRYWKKKKAAGDVSTKLSSYEEAMQQLELLKKYSLSSAEDSKLYHTKLGDIFKRFATRQYGSNYQNKTTGEILLMVKKEELDAMSLSNLATILRINDAVKFAKYLPPSEESYAAIPTLKEIINSINAKTVIKPV